VGENVFEKSVWRIYKWLKNFDERPHRRESGFFTAEKLHRPVGSNTVRCCSRPDAAIDFFAAYTAAVTRSAFSGPDIRQKLSLPFAYGLHLMHGSLAPSELPAQMASRSVYPFLQGSRTWPTDRQTYRQTDHTTPSVAIGRIASINVNVTGHVFWTNLLLRYAAKMRRPIGLTATSDVQMIVKRIRTIWRYLLYIYFRLQMSINGEFLCKRGKKLRLGLWFKQLELPLGWELASGLGLVVNIRCIGTSVLVADWPIVAVGLTVLLALAAH